MNAVKIETNNFGDEFFIGPQGSAKIVKGLKGCGYKWRIYLFQNGSDDACDWGDVKTRKECRETASNWASTGHC